ncbi:MAG: hypothetical protein DHS20C21_06170 [Gemmatimonadota bacterium]|nr:MAG: hypothetical protein DHS20C21_06170 [Gemmatimonadota bacterium]
MSWKSLAPLLLCAAYISSPPPAQADRFDAIWARSATGPITLDGNLNEPEWAQAESMVIEYGKSAGIPGSGWKVEAGQFIPSDSSSAVMKFLTVGDQLYLGMAVSDSSVGGSAEFNRFDGILMALKDHLSPNAPKPPNEYFYSWWSPDSLTPDPQPAGKAPAFVGRWAEWPPGSPRTAEQIANWDAVTVVNGLSNDDSVVDSGYVVEMRFNLAAMGYNVTQPAGDIVEWNISLYDSDWFWPFNAAKFTTNRVWWQSPWGNAMWYNEVRIHVRPDVTTSSGAVPVLGPELVIAQIPTAPTIDGDLSDPVWSNPDVHTFDIRYGDAALRQTYEGVGPSRAGQFQPLVQGGEAFVVDPGDATVKIYHADEMLYLGFDVRDLVVQFHPDINRWDGFLVLLNEYDLPDNDGQLLARRISFQVDQFGEALAQDYLGTLITGGFAQVALNLKAGTTVDTLGLNKDTGYTAELAIDLTGMGYPLDLGDGRLFLGINHLDGDSFIPVTDSYGTRTWWYREYEAECCPVNGYLAPFPVSVGEVASSRSVPNILAYPNPSTQPVIQFSLPQRRDVTLEVFDVTGRLVQRTPLGTLNPGSIEAAFDGAGRSAGVYLYRLKLVDPETHVEQASPYGKLVLLK